MDEYRITCSKVSVPPRGNTIDWFPLTHTTHHHPQQCRLCRYIIAGHNQPARGNHHICTKSPTSPLPQRISYNPVQRDNGVLQSPTHVASLQGSARRHKINPATQVKPGTSAVAPPGELQRNKTWPTKAAKNLLPLPEGDRKTQERHGRQEDTDL